MCPQPGSCGDDRPACLQPTQHRRARHGRSYPLLPPARPRHQLHGGRMASRQRRPPRCRRLPSRNQSKGRPPVDIPEGQRRITAFWNTVAPDYESPGNVAPVGTADYAKWVEALRSVLPTSPARVLDVGTGTGFVARIAAVLGHRVTAIDLSEGMLDASSARDCGLAITFAVGDAVDPPFPAGSFDVVVSRTVMATLLRPGLAFRNWC